MDWNAVKLGLPFNFQGHLTSSQKKELVKWLNEQLTTTDKVRDWHSVRAAQLRRSSALLVDAHAESNLPTAYFQKEVEKVIDSIVLLPQEDARPANDVANAKQPFLTVIQAFSEAMFQQRRLKALVELHEDLAQEQEEAKDTVSRSISDLEACFGLAHYQANLVDDESNLYEGEPYFRVHPLQKPTPFEVRTYSLDPLESSDTSEEQ